MVYRITKCKLHRSSKSIVYYFIDLRMTARKDSGNGVTFYQTPFGCLIK